MIFWKNRKKIKFNFFFVLSPLKIICFVEKKKIFLSFCQCILESDTVKCDYPIQENDEIFNTDCWFTLLVLLFVLEIFIKKHTKNGHFSLNLKKIP